MDESIVHVAASVCRASINTNAMICIIRIRVLFTSYIDIDVDDASEPVISPNWLFSFDVLYTAANKV